MMEGKMDEQSTFHKRGQDFDVLVDKDEDAGLFVVEVLDLPDVYSQGKTLDEALRNIQEAIQLHLAREGEPPRRGHRQLHRIQVPV
jgi:predicted RNase H-like HicB family nuclease